MDQEQIDKTRRRGIYLLPNLLTTAGLFAGFYSIVAALKGYFDVAAHAIFVAMIMDILDGRVARLTNTQSPFGTEFDSLSDVVSFGVAPALVVYSWSLTSLGKFGWLAAFLFTAMGALRLARFNTQVTNSDKRYFQGLPIPAAAGVMATIVWLWHDYVTQSLWFEVLMAVTTTLLGLLMVSNIRYNSFKQFNLKDKVRFITVLLGVLAFVCIAIDPPIALFALFTCYAISGPILTLVALNKKRALRRMAIKRRKEKRASKGSVN